MQRRCRRGTNLLRRQSRCAFGSLVPIGGVAAAGTSAESYDVRCRLTGELAPVLEGLARNSPRGGSASSPALDALRLRAESPTGVSGPLRDSGGGGCGDGA